MRILVVNGPNLNMLGVREPGLYGSESYASLVEFIEKTARAERVHVEVFQSNHEGALVDVLQSALGRFDGIVINPAAYTHTSVALLDALKAVNLPAIEVHLTDVNAREAFRAVSYVRLACVDTISGQGFEGYAEAIRRLKARADFDGKRGADMLQ